MSRWRPYNVLELTRESGEQITAQVVFDPAHLIYGGHFPGRPVTPGVCIVGMVKDIVQSALERPLIMSGARSVKFHHPLVPEAGRRIAVEVLCRADGPDHIAIRATVGGPEMKYCSLQAQYRIES